MKPSLLSKAQFIQRYGAVYEDSPWVAELVWPEAQAGKLDRPEALRAAMSDVINGAPRAQRLALIKAHPELAGRTAVAGAMAEASVREQAGAGLDRCTPAEFEEFQALNAAYNARFGFPFVVAVKGLSRQDILAAFRQRLNNARELEMDTALEQIHRIAAFRLKDIERP